MIPSRKSAEKDLLAVILSPSPRGTVLTKSGSRSSGEDGGCKNSGEKSGSGVKMMHVEPRPVSVTVENIPFSETNISFEKSVLDAKAEIREASPPSLEQPNISPPEQIPGADKWIPTQNPSGETLSIGDNIDSVSVDNEPDNIAISNCVLPTPQKTSSDHSIDEQDSSVGRDLFCLSALSPSNSCKNRLSAGRHNVDLDCSNTSVHTPHASQSNSLYRSNSPLSTLPHSPPSHSPQPPPELQSNFLTWLSTQEPTVEICYLERTALAIEELRKIKPEQPFSDYFLDFAFIE
nr:hypothetical transcript [Hymenolepis microstoma]